MNKLIGMTLIAFTLGIITYGNHFSFQYDAFSFLGGLHTQEGNPNLPSFLIFATSMILSALLCFRISYDMDNQMKKIMFRISGIGYLLMSAPCDLFDSIHTTGGVLVFGSLYFFILTQLIELSQMITKYKAFLYHFILQITILPYAFLYFNNSPYCQLAQKIAFFGLILMLKVSTQEFINYYKEKTENSIHSV